MRIRARFYVTTATCGPHALRAGGEFAFLAGEEFDGDGREQWKKLARVNNHEQSHPKAGSRQRHSEATASNPEKKAPRRHGFLFHSNPWNTVDENGEPACFALCGCCRCPVAALPGVRGNGTEKPLRPSARPTQKVIEEADLPAAAIEAIRE